MDRIGDEDANAINARTASANHPRAELITNTSMKERVVSFRKGKITQSELVNTSNHKKNMPLDFLKCPSFRLNIHQIVDSFMEYSVAFNLQSREDELGLTISTNSRSGDIYVSGVQGKNYDPHLTSLALSSGIRQYDVLIGINTQYFDSGVEEQDIREMIEGSEKYVTLHFIRGSTTKSTTTSRTNSSLSPRFGRESMIDNLRVSLISPSSSGHLSLDSPASITNTPTTHPCTRIFIDQGLITAESAHNNTIAIGRLKQRVLTWDENTVARPIASLSNREQYTSSPNRQEVKSTKVGGGVLSPLFSPPPVATFDKSSTLLKRASERLRPSSIQASLKNILNGTRASSLESLGGSQPEANTLRPALSTHILSTQQVDDYTVYNIWVMDVRTGCEWEVGRRYREFYRFREVLISIRPSLKNMRTQFPKKTFAKTPSKVVKIKRFLQFRKFLREVSSIICMNSFHPSTIKLQLAFQDFLSVTAQIPRILRKERTMIVDLIRNTVEVYVHSILHMRVMDPVLYGHVDRFLDKCSEETGHWKAASWTDTQGRKLLTDLADFIKNLHDVIFEGIVDDCDDVVAKMLQNKEVHEKLLFQRKIHLEQFERRERKYQQRSIEQRKEIDSVSAVAGDIESKRLSVGRNRAGTQLAFDSFTGVHSTYIAPGSTTESTQKLLTRFDSNGSIAKRRSSYTGATSFRDHSSSILPADAPAPRLSDAPSWYAASTNSFKQSSFTAGRVRAQSLAEFLDLSPMAAPEELIIDDAKSVTVVDTDDDASLSRPRPVSLKRTGSSRATARETGRPSPSPNPSDHIKAISTKMSELVITTSERNPSPLSTGSADSNSSGSVFASFKRNMLGGSSNSNQDEILTESERNMTDIPNVVDLGDIHNFYSPSENDRDNEELTSLLSSRQASTVSVGFQTLDMSIPAFEQMHSFLAKSSETLITVSSASSGADDAAISSTTDTTTAASITEEITASKVNDIVTSSVVSTSSPPSAVASEKLSSSSDPVFFTEDDIETMIREAVRKQVEVEVYTPSLEVLRAVLVVSFRDHELDVERKIDILYNKNQDDFGIRTKLQSPSGWVKVIEKFKTIRRYLVPIDKLRVLLKVSTMIPDLIEVEHPNLLDPIGADDFLPIFIYVLVKARINQIVYLNQELQSLCDPDKKLGEIGYYLATLDAAIQHLHELNVNGGTKLAPSWHYQDITE